MSTSNIDNEYKDLFAQYNESASVEESGTAEDDKDHHYSDRFVKYYRAVGFGLMIIALGAGLLVGFSLGGGNFMELGSIITTLGGTAALSLVWLIVGNRKELQRSTGSRVDKKIAKLQRQKDKKSQKKKE